MSRKLFCAVCKKHGKSEAEYTSHNAREENDETSRPLCPILCDMKCNRCGNVGHIAAKCPDKACVFCNNPGHTVFYCTNAPRDQIDAFLRQRNQDYEERKWRNQNGRFEMRRNDSNQRNDESQMFRPKEDPRNESNQRNDQRNDQRNESNQRVEMPLPFRQGGEPAPMFRYNQRDERPPMFRDNYRDERPPMFRDQGSRLPVFREEQRPPVKKDEFPSLTKEEDFPALGKPKAVQKASEPVPVLTTKMNFVGVTSVMLAPVPKRVAPEPKYEPEYPIYANEEDDEEEEELDIFEYRERLYNKLTDEFHRKNTCETWDAAYKRIMKIVDSNAIKYENYMAMKNNRSSAAGRTEDDIGYYYNRNDTDNDW